MPNPDPAVIRRQRERRLKLIRTVGSECAFCGSAEDLITHHVDSERKRGNLSEAIFWPEHLRTLEAAKTVVLCRSCHSIEHAEQRGHNVSGYVEDGPHDHRGYWNGCRCSVCRAAHAAYERASRSNRSGS